MTYRLGALIGLLIPWQLNHFDVITLFQQEHTSYKFIETIAGAAPTLTIKHK